MASGAGGGGSSGGSSKRPVVMLGRLWLELPKLAGAFVCSWLDRALRLRAPPELSPLDDIHEPQPRSFYSARPLHRCDLGASARCTTVDSGGIIKQLLGRPLGGEIAIV